MIDISKTIAPKSDQLNADALMGGSMTIKVSDVTLTSSIEQPVSIHYAGGEGKPFKPCLSMRRLLVRVWGKDGSQYIGRSMTLFCDEKVRWSGAEVGGVRISHLSCIDAPITMALTETKGRKKSYTVRPLVIAAEAPDPAPNPADPVLISAGLAASSDGVEIYKQWLAGLTAEQKAQIKSQHAAWSIRAKTRDEEINK